MEHIKTQYGVACNLLELSIKDYKKLDAFLQRVGIRSRITKEYDGVVTIQAENPYRAFINIRAKSVNEIEFIKRLADEEMEEEAIAAYKR